MRREWSLSHRWLVPRRRWRWCSWCRMCLQCFGSSECTRHAVLAASKARRTRFSVTLEIDAAALFFPIAKPGRLGAGGAAEFPGSWRRAGRIRSRGRRNGVRGHGVVFGSVRHCAIVPEFGLWDHRKPVEKQGVSPWADETRRRWPHDCGPGATRPGRIVTHEGA
jgi:hypothetical protein